MNAFVRAAMAACGLVMVFTFTSAIAQTGPAAALDALVKAAKAEGSVTWYMSFDDAIARRVNEAFRAKYGINAASLRLSTVMVVQRFSAEAHSAAAPCCGG